MANVSDEIRLAEALAAQKVQRVTIVTCDYRPSARWAHLEKPSGSYSVRWEHSVYGGGRYSMSFVAGDTEAHRAGSLAAHLISKGLRQGPTTTERGDERTFLGDVCRSWVQRTTVYTAPGATQVPW